MTETFPEPRPRLRGLRYEAALREEGTDPSPIPSPDQDVEIAERPPGRIRVSRVRHGGTLQDDHLYTGSLERLSQGEQELLELERVAHRSPVTVRQGRELGRRELDRFRLDGRERDPGEPLSVQVTEETRPPLVGDVHRRVGAAPRKREGGDPPRERRHAAVKRCIHRSRSNLVSRGRPRA